jgi:Protein kinase domain
MKVCPNCQNKYPDDANFCPREGCASAEGPSRLMPAAEEVPARFAPSTMIGGSRSGEVWQAQDGQTGELVAYKLVAPAALPTVAAVERAQRELKQLMRSQSPRIARVLDCGKSPDGRLFIATELCAGEPLDHVIERSGPLSLERTKKIIAQIGEALLEGQKVGVVHHDLSPKNVLIEGDDEVKLINFTVAVPITDRVFGVAEFLSPEQGEGKPADQRSNTYGLGAMAVFLLTGAPPFAGATPQAVVEQVLRGEVTPPSQRRSELTPEIDRVILRAMDKNSSRRPLTLRQFLNEVQSMHLGGAPAARPAPSLNRTIAYSGGAPEVRRLVAEATAARAEANGSGPAVAYSPVSAAPAPAVVAAPGPAPVAAAAQAPAAPRPDPAATPAPPAVRAPDPSSLPTPPPVALPNRAHGAAVAATMMAMPAAPPQNRAPVAVPAANNTHASAPSQATPPPVVPARAAEPTPADARRPAPVASAGAAATAQAQGTASGQGANFRETLWFKKGDVEQMVAEAKAKAASAAAVGRAEANGAAELPPEDGHGDGHEDGKPLEDRYLDDGSVTVEDRKKFSLRAGGTAASVPVVAASMPGDRMSESEMFNEIGGGKRVKVIAIAALAVAAVVAVLFFTMRGKGVEKAAVPVPAPTAAVTKPADEPAAPVAKAPEAPAAAAAAPNDEAEPPHAKEAAAAHETPPAVAKARAPKRKAAKHAPGKKKH